MILSSCFEGFSACFLIYNELIETTLVMPVTIPASSIWIFLYPVFAECNYPKQHLCIQVLV